MAAYMKLGDIKGDAASDAFAFGLDVAEQHKDHKNWINVESCNMATDRATATTAPVHSRTTRRLPRPRSLTGKSN